MSNLILVRHGETAWNDEARYQGQLDVPLSARGWVEAECLAHRLVGESLDAIYSSDLSRARDTARVIADRVRQPVHVEPRLREIRLGEWQGLEYGEVRRRYFAGAGPLPPYSLEWAPPGGESLRELETRMTRSIQSIIAQHPDQTILVVTHGACLKVLVCRWLGMELSRYWQLHFDSGSISQVFWSPHRIVVSQLNRTAHLRPEEIA